MSDRGKHDGWASVVTVTLTAALVLVLFASACSTSVGLESRPDETTSSSGDESAVSARTTDAADAEAASTESDADGGGTDSGSGSVSSDVGAIPTDGPPSSVHLGEVYDDISDSIVFIDSYDATGTGIVIEGGWVLTNAHVVERSPEVRLGGHDGTDLGWYPVYATDWLFDLALVGPIDDVDLEPLGRSVSADLAIGDGVMLIGFPDESNQYPTPTLTSGIVSRRRYPAVGNFPFLQVDATIAPGQSGGALVDLDGNLMGISGLEFGAGEFGLAFESDAMWPRIDRLIAEGVEPGFPDAAPQFRLQDEVGPRRTRGFAMRVDETGLVNLVVQSEADAYIDVRTATGLTYTEYPPAGDPFEAPFDAGETTYFIDDLTAGGEELTGELPSGVYEVIIGAFAEAPSEINVSSDNELVPFADIEEGAQLPVGELVEGVIDWPQDSDRWTLPLEAGDVVTITTDGIADTVLAVRLDDEFIVGSDDQLIGLFGTGARVEFRASETAVYEVEIGSWDTARWGYLVEVEIG